VGHAQVLKVAAYGLTGRCKKKENKKQMENHGKLCHWEENQEKK